MWSAFFLAFSLYAAPLPGGAVVSEAINTWCRDLSKELLSVNYERCVGRSWENSAASRSGKPIPFTWWGDPAGRRILVLGAVHGDEISSVSLVFRWMDFLDKTKPDSFVRKNRYLFLPLINPDGFFASPRTRTNEVGVDLNRNFTTAGWAEEALAHWRRKTKSDPRRYPGKVAGSESETQVIQKWIEEYKPELIISIHAPYGLVDHDGPIHFHEITGLSSPLPVKTLGSFPGSLGKYAGVERKIPVVTVELPAAKRIPEIKAIEDLLVYILKAKF